MMFTTIELLRIRNCHVTSDALANAPPCGGAAIEPELLIGV